MAAIPAVRIPDIDTSRLDRPKIGLPDAIAKLELPTIDMPHVDLAGALPDAATAAGLRRPAQRARWPFAIGALIVAGAAGWGLMKNPQLRTRLRELADSVRERISSMRSAAFSQASDRAEPIAFPAADTRAIPPDPWGVSEHIDTPDYPDGLGSGKEDPIPAHQEIKSRS